MTHYPTLVCLPADVPAEDLVTRIQARMDRWDESRFVPPYREYEEGSPEDFWFVGALRERRTPEHAALADRLGPHPGWAEVTAAYNECHPPYDPADTADQMQYDAELDRAYTISTINPERRWDYWLVGGRFRDTLLARVDADPADLVWKDPDNTTRDDRTGLLRCDGGRRGALDFATMRAEAVRRVEQEYAAWAELCARTPEALGWSHFRTMVDRGELTLAEARRLHEEQPRVRAARETDLVPITCPVRLFAEPLAERRAQARTVAVPGHALVTLDGQWWEPGLMAVSGHRGRRDKDPLSYWAAANHYLNTLDPHVWVVLLDCHT